MIIVKFLGPIEFDDMKLDVKTLDELKQKLSEYNELELKEWLKICAVSVNDEIVTELNTPLRDGDVVCILPPVCGG
ncbi:MoaD/ThiS family protein [Campylobacter mucosalis]|uniref:MoaD/ThiS family protein n=1 Tax=Campylobacter mucosalis TaxID=202 RepID=UPI00146FD536|nr:MoaD/ThiS family protein [Campylobacter mucosalis]